MTDSEQPFLSRRERREAERAVSGESSDFVAEQSLVDAPLTDLRSPEQVPPSSFGGIPSRKDLRRLARETGVIPMLTAEMLDQAEKGILDIEDEIRHRTASAKLPVSSSDGLPATDSVTPRIVGFEDIIAPATPTTPAPVELMNVDVELPVSPPPATTAYVEVEQSHTSAPITPIIPEPVAAAPAMVREPVVVPAASPEIPPARDGDWREQLETDNEHEWVKNHETGMGVMQSPTLQTLVVDSYHTGDITGPLNPTGEILITGQIILDPIIEEEPAVDAIDAGVEVNQPGIPRRASEALSIIGKPAAAEERKKIPSVGSSVAAGIAAFLGLAVIVLGLLAYFTDII